MQRYSLKEHVNTVHFNQTKFECDHCNFKATRRVGLLVHFRGNHKFKIDQKYDKKAPKRQCNHCGLIITNWRRHILRVHTRIKNVFCDICPYSTYFKSDLEQHMQVHIRQIQNERQKFVCDACGVEFKGRAGLSKHFKAQHMTQERNYQCPICQKCKFN